MIEFVNAKINIGLQVVNRRKNGYHDLQTIFYPIGKYAGTPRNPETFCDILDVTEIEKGVEIIYEGRVIDCKPEDNIVSRAVRLYSEAFGMQGKGVRIRLDKHLPYGAGMGGGSADGAFTLMALHKLSGAGETIEDLADLSLKLGADCPFFIYNKPMFGEGLGEILTPIPDILKGFWAVCVKPHVFVSTKEAFSGITPCSPDFDLRLLPETPIEKWQEIVKNDFENSIFPIHPELAEIKNMMLSAGALYSSMSGSGSSIYGIFKDKEHASLVKNEFAVYPTIEQSYLLDL